VAAHPFRQHWVGRHFVDIWRGGEAGFASVSRRGRTSHRRWKHGICASLDAAEARRMSLGQPDPLNQVRVRTWSSGARPGGAADRLCDRLSSGGRPPEIEWVIA
jgi:hypothetical protein